MPEPLRGIVADIDVPAPFGTRTDRLPEFAPRLLQEYADDGKETPFRAAVKKARTALVEQVKELRMREEFRATPRPADLKNEVLKKQKDVARSLGELTDLLDDLKKAGDALDAEPTKRWRANYEYILARLELQIGWLNEYQFALGELRRERAAADRSQRAQRLAFDHGGPDAGRSGQSPHASRDPEAAAAHRPGASGNALGMVRQARPGGAEGLIWKPAKLGE